MLPTKGVNIKKEATAAIKQIPRVSGDLRFEKNFCKNSTATPNKTKAVI